MQYDAAKTPHLIEIDEDFDGWIDRWEYYDGAGTLTKVGASRRGHSPDVWTYPGPGGVPTRREYDDDRSGRVSRVEILRDGKLLRTGIDSARTGRFDRWQNWQAGRIVSEEIDTDGDGKPDRRLRYGAKGQVVALEPVPRE